MRRSDISGFARHSRLRPQSLLGFACCLVIGLRVGAVGCADNGSDGVAGSGGAAGIGGAGGSRGVFADCINPSPDNRCECYPSLEDTPWGPWCGSEASCSLGFLTNSEGTVIGIPALDGSDGTKATKCVALTSQPNARGEPCSVLTESVSVDVNVRHDTCAPYLFCHFNRCASLCSLQDDCFPGGCSMLTVDPETGGSLGVCEGGGGGGGDSR